MDCHVFDEASAILRTSRNRARVSQRMVEMVGRHSVADSAQKQTTAATRYTATGAVWRRANGDAEAAQRRVCGRSVRVHSAVVGSCSRTRLHASHGGCMRCKWACGAGAGAGTEWCLSKSDGGWAGGVVWCGVGVGVVEVVVVVAVAVAAVVVVMMVMVMVTVIVVAAAAAVVVVVVVVPSTGGGGGVR